MIIHFTKKFEFLSSIINSKSFRLKYCCESIGDKEGRIVSNAAHPMVSFSEFNDNDLEHKTITYGRYGIALKKDWARKLGIGPVLYVEKNSPAAKGLVSLLRARQNMDTLPDELRLPIIQMKCFTKHETGYNSWNGDENFCFKSENEWRFVPSKKQIGNRPISENYSTYKANEQKYNKQLLPHPLSFSEEDIECIYTNTLAEKEELISTFGMDERQIKISSWKS
ncbi:hypothetical protein PUND_b0454 [Pseudoalteromonas undina]|uniref:Uncharacterized protein n=1 Tax=Pseudoalteromonas undina TaxID=43660 RepID=A0ABP2XYR8_9GAMM|nr:MULTISPECIES: abortive infection system antitoxin AbiGi family protein [Pseudoalteromonas]KAF7763119.1 hypothetical protein PUND_b0454 [Pseudoalteromonas undina]PKH90271.1 hypothetical protein CXF76_17445 [Pseudoalteromonas sp. 78C3]